MKTEKESVPIPGEILRNEEFAEPCNPENMGHAIFSSVPLKRLLEKLDSYLLQKDYAGAERHLAYWLNEADEARNDGAKLAILNEQINLYREIGKKEECLAAITKAYGLTDLSGSDQSASCAMTIVNMANGYRFFDQPEKALPLYCIAADICSTALPEDDIRLGGLYNNMALALTDTGEYREAEALFRKIGNDLGLANTLQSCGDLARKQASNEEGYRTAAALYEEAKALYEKVNEPIGLSYTCAELYECYTYLHETEKANAVREQGKALLDRVSQRAADYVREKLRL